MTGRLPLPLARAIARAKKAQSGASGRLPQFSRGAQADGAPTEKSPGEAQKPEAPKAPHKKLRGRKG